MNDVLVSSSDYYLNRFYKARRDNLQYDDNANEDQWQLEIYLHALAIMKKNAFHSVLDIGCGSGYKLITYLGDYQTTGLELTDNVDLLSARYPDRQWQVSDFDKGAGYSVDVAICSDVIEHLVDPDELIDFLAKIKFRYLVLSSPARDLMHKRWHPLYYGPPVNKAHVREWTQHEFKQYISSRFTVLDHRVTNLEQCTQLIVCTK